MDLSLTFVTRVYWWPVLPGSQFDPSYLDLKLNQKAPGPSANCVPSTVDLPFLDQDQKFTYYI